MKRIEIIALSAIALFIASGSILSGSYIAFFASFFQLSAGGTFFALNAILGIAWIQNRQTKSFIKKSAIPFMLAYIISVILNTLYWVSLSKTAEFKAEYLIDPWPHKESLLLISLYFLGLFYGYLRGNKRAITITISSITGIALVLTVFYFKPFKKSMPEIEGVHLIDKQYSSISELVSLPQFSDKTVYVDMWHTQCGPCIAQFKNHLPQLKRKLDSDKVSYLYLARETSPKIDSRRRWIQMLEKYHLTGWHYYIAKDYEAMFWKEIHENIELQLPGYPHYLIARDGRIISYDAPKPSEMDDETIQSFFIE